MVRELAQMVEHAGGKQQMQVQALYSQFFMKINFNIERGEAYGRGLTHKRHG